jgi:integrase
VDKWWDDLQAEHPTRPTGNAHAYSLLRTILGTAVKDDLIAANPCRIEKAGQAARQRPINVATDDDLAAIADAMPAQYALAVHLAAFCALRFGELAELRRRDVDASDPDMAVLNVSRAMVHRGGWTRVGPTKNADGRDVHVPPHLRDALLEHIEAHAQPGLDGLLFAVPSQGHRRPCDCGYAGCSGGHLTSAALYRFFGPARVAAGRPDLRWHDLRHTGAVDAARAGAILAEQMARLGHRTVAASMRYQHATKERDAELARRMSAQRR